MDINQYNDSSMLTTGPYKFTRLINIPSEWLLGVYKKYQKSKLNNNKKKYNNFDKRLIEYIERNLELIKARKDNPVKDPTGFGHKSRGLNSVQLTCEATGKLVFLSEKEAKEEIKKAKILNFSSKKPKYCYECEHCSYWHLTSQDRNKHKSSPDK